MFDNKEDYAIQQQTMATNGGKTIVKHEECFGNDNEWPSMVARPQSISQMIMKMDATKKKTIQMAKIGGTSKDDFANGNE